MPLCAVVLAAGLGTRLRPLTDVLPKALCPINKIPLIDLALDSVQAHISDIAVNVHWLADLLEEHLAARDMTIADERALIRGSAGALGNLQDWIAGRDVLVRNVDAYLTADLAELLEGWDGQRPRLLARDRGVPSDFGTLQYIGACLLPAHNVAALGPEPASLYDLIWKPAFDRGDLEFVITSGEFVDCGTPHDYLLANMLASGGKSVVGDRAVIEGTLDRVVVWANGHVGADEHLHECIRMGSDVTVDASEGFR